MIKIDVIFFDIDGTLVDSSVDIVAGVNATLKKLGIPRDKGSGEIMSYVGTGVKYLIRKSAGIDDDKTIDEGVKLFSDYFMKHAADNAKVYPHVGDILEYYKDKKKYIVTNRYERFADATLKGVGIRKYFGGIIAGDDESCLKPSVCVLDPVLLNTGVDRKKTMIVGDMAVDVMSGKNSGIKTCWVTYGLGKREDVEPLGPDYIIDDLIELKGIVS